MDYTPEQIQEKFATLPEALQKILSSKEVEEKLHDIAESHNLHIDKIDALVYETVVIMLGLAPTQSYSKNLASHLGIEPDLANAIAHDIDEQIFQEVKKALQSADAGNPAGEEIVEENTHPSREEILAEVENEVNVSTQKAEDVSVGQQSDITPDRQAPIVEMDKEDSAEISAIPDAPQIAPELPEDTAVSEPAVGRNIVEEKLSGEFKIPSEESQQHLEEKKEEAPKKTFDPYREPID